MVCNIILPRIGKFEYATFLDLFVMCCLITRRQMNLDHLLVNQMKAACEKKRQGLPYCMLFTHIFQVVKVDMGGKDQEKPKASKEYNKKTLRLMGFIENEDREWIKKRVATPQQSVTEDEDIEEKEDEEDEASYRGAEAADTPSSPPSGHASTSCIALAIRNGPQLSLMEDSLRDLKDK